MGGRKMVRRFLIVVAVVALGVGTFGVGVAEADPASGTLSCTAVAKGSFSPPLTNSANTVTFLLQVKTSGCSGNTVDGAQTLVDSVHLHNASCLNNLGTDPIPSDVTWTPGSVDASHIDFQTRKVGAGFTSLKLGGPVYDTDAKITTGSFATESAVITLNSLSVKAGKGGMAPCTAGIKKFLGTGTFVIPTGAPAGTAAVTGTVSGPSGVIDELPVQVCKNGGDCDTVYTAGGGIYSLGTLASGAYTVTAFSPAGTSLLSQSASIVLTDHSTTHQDFVLDGPTPPPAGTTITNHGTNDDGIPTVVWTDPLTLETTGCLLGTATYQIIVDGNVVRSGPMEESPSGSGHYAATGTESLYPNHGDAQVHLSITCPDTSVESTDFDIYIDPSGLVVDQASHPVVGATVTLYHSNSKLGPFTIVPNGSAVMSPGNRTNPMVSGSDGAFGWDVVAGYYRVRAQKSGCVARNGADFVETAALTIPPPVLNLMLRLDCGTVPAACPTLRITTPALPVGALHQSYSARLRYCGSSLPVAWKKMGALPKGLKLSKSGMMTGAPKARGTFYFKIQVRDSGNKMTRQTATKSLSIRVQ